jgi:hypothetical protein
VLRLYTFAMQTFHEENALVYNNILPQPVFLQYAVSMTCGSLHLPMVASNTVLLSSHTPIAYQRLICLCIGPFVNHTLHNH